MPRLRRLVSAAAILVVAVAMPGWAAAADTDGTAAQLIDEVGGGFVQQGPDTGPAASPTRHFVGPGARLDLQVVPALPGIDVAKMFRSVGALAGTELVPEPSLPLAAWMVGEGEQPGDRAGGVLVFVAADGIYSALLTLEPGSEVDPVEFLTAVARRQLERSGPPEASTVETPDGSPREGVDPEMAALLPDDAGGLQLVGTFDLGADIPDDVQTAADAERFLDEGTDTVVRVWTTADGSVVAVMSLTEYPLSLFAAASLGTIGSTSTTRPVREPSIEAVRGAVAFLGTGGDQEQIGAAIRRGRYMVTVLVNRPDEVDRASVVGLVTEMTADAAAALPPGDSTPYRFPGARSKIAGIALSIGFVTLAAGGALAVGRTRARSARGRLSTGANLAAAGPAPAGVVTLDADAARLRRRAGFVLGGQFLTLNVGVGALSGDFGWTGVYVAAAALVAGLVFTAWWRRRELALLGPVAPRIDRMMPQPRGAALGVMAFAVLGFGAAFGLKGLRYLVLKPTLAQLKWADLFGMTPQQVGVLFAVGGVGAFVVGAQLVRLARAASRADTRRLLAADHRPPMLYLRSFEDDSVVLATIVSARRPMLELFSLRGADPFEESLAAELDTYGPVIAVGRPGRPLASLGAAREHLPDATWRDQVAARMEDARTIVVAVGETAGLHWEISRIVQGAHLSKTVFVFPPLPTDTLERRWSFTGEALRAAGAVVDALPVGALGVHTVQVRGDGALRVTTARRRDEASYRTAVDRMMDLEVVLASAEDELGDGAHRVG